MKHLTHIILLITILLVSCKQLYYYNVNTTVQPVEGGSIAMTPSANPVLEGTLVSFKATPYGDYIFTGWSGSLSGTENPKSVLVTSDMAVTANFVLRDYPLTLSVEGEGSIDEKVISTKTDYSSGTVVELTAVPAAGWSFDHWDGDLAGSENPTQLTISSAKTVKAYFTQNHYDYSLRIIGPGVVNEQLMPDTKGYLSGTRVQLTAVPSPADGSCFVGWSGDASGTDPTIVIEMDGAKNIVALFKDAFDDPEITPRQTILTKPSRCNPRLFFGKDFISYTNIPYKFTYVDYNLDGIRDIVTCNAYGEWGVMNWTPDPIGFYLGQADGSFKNDPNNDARIEGLIGTRKILYGDYNTDGYPDMFFIAGGYDFSPFPGEYCLLVLSDGNGSYTETRFPQEHGHYHGGASGDIDNDGDLDIVTTLGYHPVFFVNDGSGHFDITKDLIDYDCERMFNGELYDINHDGFLDFICGGHCWEGPDDSEEKEGIYNNDPIIFWGNGISYEKEKSTRLPKCSIDGFGLVCDFLFEDLDGDGQEEIIISRTGDNAIQGGPAYYGGWHIQIVKAESENRYYDATSNYISLSDSYVIRPMHESWVVWLDVEEINGEKYLLGAHDMGNPNAFRLMKIGNGELTKVPTASFDAFGEGFTVYSDQFDTSEWHYKEDLIEIACTDSPKEGKNCIKWKTKGAWQQELDSKYESSIDLTPLVESGYELEFYIKNTNKDLSFFINLEAQYNAEGFDQFYHEFTFTNEECDGQWHRIHVPLSSFDHSHMNDSWSKIQAFRACISSEGTEGTEFYLDEIRIRKVLPE